MQTLTGFESDVEGQRALWTKRLMIGVLLVLVLSGAAGFLGVSDTTSSATGGGYDLTVRYADAARAGLDVPFEVTVVREGGFGDELTIAVTATWFDQFETQGFNPEPSASTRDGEFLELTFDAPDGDVFRVAYDAYIQPSIQRGRSATVAVLDAGVPVASVEVRTRILP